MRRAALSLLAATGGAGRPGGRKLAKEDRTAAGRALKVAAAGRAAVWCVGKGLLVATMASCPLLLSSRLLLLATGDELTVMNRIAILDRQMAVPLGNDPICQRH